MVPMLYRGRGEGAQYLWRVDPTYDPLRVPFMDMDSCYEQLWTIAGIGLVYTPDRTRRWRSSYLLGSNLSHVGWGVKFSTKFPPSSPEEIKWVLHVLCCPSSLQQWQPVCVCGQGRGSSTAFGGMGERALQSLCVWLMEEPYRLSFHFSDFSVGVFLISSRIDHV